MITIPRTDVRKALDRRSSRLHKKLSTVQSIQELLSDSRPINSFDFNSLETSRIYSLKQIRSVCIDYRLRFLDLKYFKATLPQEAFDAVSALEKQHQTQLEGFKIMAPSSLFRLNKTDDPLLFIPLGNDHYYLVHQWGNDLHPLRRLLMWPFKNLWNLLFVLLGVSGLLTAFTPTRFFTTTSDSTVFWMLFFFMFKSIVAVVMFYGVALGKNFNPVIWNSHYDKV
ncbi:MAG: hypothetical protein ACPGC5_04625 [Flavobacteriaceae bacterium]